MYYYYTVFFCFTFRLFVRLRNVEDKGFFLIPTSYERIEMSTYEDGKLIVKIYDGFSFEENKPFTARIRKEENEFQVGTNLVSAKPNHFLIFLCTHY